MNPIQFETFRVNKYASTNSVRVKVDGETVTTLIKNDTAEVWYSLPENITHTWFILHSSSLENLKYAVTAIALYVWASNKGYKATRVCDSLVIESRFNKIKSFSVYCPSRE